MDFNGFKELYDVSLKTTSNMEINGQTYEKNETLINFDKIEVAYLQQDTTRVPARGGKGNEILLLWEDTKEMKMTLSKGIISDVGLGLISNSKLTKKAENIVTVPYDEVIEESERIETEKYQITTKYPIKSNLFVYRDGVKVTPEWTEDSNIIIINGYDDGTDNPTYTVTYDFLYTKSGSELLIGQRLLNGFLRITGKLRVKEDETGVDKTCLFEIPKARIMSDLTLRLGSSVTPNVFNFNLVGTPVEENGTRYVCKFTLLDDDIDSDIF